MADDPVGEVDQAIEALDGLHWALNARHEVEDRPNYHKLERQALVNLSPVTSHRQPDIRQEREHRDKEAKRSDNGQRLKPAGCRRLQDMVLPDQPVEEGDRPESY